jgi:hypothetical protein
MQLRLSDPGYTDRLATFLKSLRQTVFVTAPGQLDVALANVSTSRVEVEIYLRVWKVLYPDADVQIVNGEDDEVPVGAA